MEKLSANRFLTGSEYGTRHSLNPGTTFVASAPSRLRQTFFAACNFRPRLSAKRRNHDENNFGPPGGMEIRIANNIKVFLWFFPKVFAFHFVQGAAQTPPHFLPCWCRMKKLSANRLLTGSENRRNHRQIPGARLAVSVTSGVRQISCKVCKCRPPFSARVAAMTKIISSCLAMSESEKLTFQVSEKFHFDQGLIFGAVSFRQNGEMKLFFDAGGEMGRNFSRHLPAAPVGLETVAVRKIKAFFGVIGDTKGKISWGKSCARNAQDDFKTLIASLCMFNVFTHKNLADARKYFDGHQPQNRFVSLGHPCGFPIRQDSNWVAGLTAGTEKTLCSENELRLLKTS
jgi:hypothetical protein